MGRMPRLLLAAALLVPAGARAQVERLAGRVDPSVQREVQRLADSAQRGGLPVDALVDKALEGSAKGAAPERIAQAVRVLFANLGTARGALGPAASASDVAIGAEALRGGARPQDLGRLRAARKSEALAVPLAVLADLVARGVPADTAAAVIVGLAERRGSDADFTNLKRDIERDIGRGVPPGSAATIRGRGSPPANVPGRGGTPPGQSKPKPNPKPDAGPPTGRP